MRDRPPPERGAFLETLWASSKKLRFRPDECHAFIKNANDLQILEAISECYNEYRVLNL